MLHDIARLRPKPSFTLPFLLCPLHPTVPCPSCSSITRPRSVTASRRRHASRPSAKPHLPRTRLPRDLKPDPPLLTAASPSSQTRAPLLPWHARLASAVPSIFPCMLEVVERELLVQACGRSREGSTGCLESLLPPALLPDSSPYDRAHGAQMLLTQNACPLSAYPNEQARSRGLGLLWAAGAAQCVGRGAEAWVCIR